MSPSWLTLGCSWVSAGPGWGRVSGQGLGSVAAGSFLAGGWRLSGPLGCWTGGSWLLMTGSAELALGHRVAEKWKIRTNIKSTCLVIFTRHNKRDKKKHMPQKKKLRKPVLAILLSIWPARVLHACGCSWQASKNKVRMQSVLTLRDAGL